MRRGLCRSSGYRQPMDCSSSMASAVRPHNARRAGYRQPMPGMPQTPLPSMPTQQLWPGSHFHFCADLPLPIWQLFMAVWLYHLARVPKTSAGECT